MRSYVAIKHFLCELAWVFATGGVILLTFAVIVGGFVYLWQKNLGTLLLPL